MERVGDECVDGVELCDCEEELYTYTVMYIYICVCVCVCVGVYICTCLHTCVHTHCVYIVSCCVLLCCVCYIYMCACVHTHSDVRYIELLNRIEIARAQPRHDDNIFLADIYAFQVGVYSMMFICRCVFLS